MSKIIKGKLHKKGPYSNNWQLFYESSKGGYRSAGFWPDSFSPGILDAPDGMLDVQFVWREPKADKIRLLTEDESVFERAASVQGTEKAQDTAQTATAGAPMPCPPASYSRKGKENNKVQRAFHNPYNFVPAVPPEQSGPLGQHKPVGHHKYHADRWNGRIEVEIETIMPLLVPDAANAETGDNGHMAFPVRTEKRNGKEYPLLAPTSVKGMLRSAYEVITNSRLGVFMGHDELLAYRMTAKDGLSLIPARVTEDGEHLELLMGTVKGAPRPQPKNEPLFAAWLPRYTVDEKTKKGMIAPWAARYPNKKLPEHKDEVWCWLEKFRHSKRGFTYWRVRKISENKNDLSKKQPSPSRENRSHAPTGDPMILVHGWVCITNQNINCKHDERVFFHNGTPIKLKLTNNLIERWKLLIQNYQDLHKEEIKQRINKGNNCDEYLGPNPGETAFSRHVCDSKATELNPYDLVYAQVNHEGVVTELFPVMISRVLEENTPKELLRPSLLPAVNINELSPADRVFGWVSQDDKGAWRGSLRIGPVRCETDGAIEDFGKDGLPLAILSTPKPQQARFYVARDDCGGAQEDGITRKAAGYTNKKGLRGRKVYPHPALVAGNDAYWNGQEAKGESSGREARQLQANGKTVYREYIRRVGEHGNRDDQNRSVRGWVKPDTTFSTWLEVQNLNAAELGALLWLLSLPDAHYLRLGGGKPLGFGSVRVRIKGLELVSGEGRKKQFESLMPVTLAEDECLTGKDKAEERFVTTYREALEKAYDGGFETIPFIDAFLKAAKGFAGKPAHYPRAQERPDPDGKNYEWFVRNEKESRDFAEWKLALPNLTDEKGLPYVPANEEQGGNGRNRHRRHHHGRGRGHRR